MGSCEFNNCESGMQNATRRRRWTWSCRLIGIVGTPFACYRVPQAGSVWVTNLMQRAVSLYFIGQPEMLATYCLDTCAGKNAGLGVEITVTDECDMYQNSIVLQ
jgi:hypothetical protein